MNQFTNVRASQKRIRWQLLTTVSALALFASAYGASEAEAADNDGDRPIVWIELGGQLDRLGNSEEGFAPPFVANLPNTFFSPLNVQKPSEYSWGEDVSISFEPKGSDWVLSASMKYGRASGNKNQHQQTPNAMVPYHFSVFGKYKHGTFYPGSHVKFEDVAANNSETHAILDFQAGKDVGLGVFGSRGSSVLSAGVRFAQFASRARAEMHMEPDVHYPSKPISSFAAWQAFRTAAIHFHDYAAIADTERNFRGVGPSLNWSASAPFVGNQDRGEIAFDWGINAAILFGRQKMRGHRQTTVRSFYKKSNEALLGTYGSKFMTVSVAQHNQSGNPNRRRSVLVPNLGGFAGISFRYSDAKVSFGYRADYFFCAMDGGIDTRKSENLGFKGPYASISIGLGD